MTKALKAVYPCEFDTPFTGLEYLQYYAKHKVYHPGVDLNKGYGNADLGNEVVCPVNGEVEYVSPSPSWRNNQNGGLGWFVVLYHPAYGTWTRYCHLNTVEVTKGQSLMVSEKIGTVGNTGTTYAHLHFEAFNKVVWELYKKHWRPYAYYPSGKTKAWIAENYQNPLLWIDAINKEAQTMKKNPSTVHKQSVDWCIENKVSNGERPQDTATREEVMSMIYKYHQSKN